MNRNAFAELLTHSCQSLRDLFTVILYHSARTGWYEAAVDDMAVDISLSERQVFRLLRVLEEMGAIEVDRTGGGRGYINKYRTTLQNPDMVSLNADTVSQKGDMDVMVTELNPDMGDMGVTVMGDIDDIKGDIDDTEPVGPPPLVPPSSPAPQLPPYNPPTQSRNILTAPAHERGAEKLVPLDFKPSYANYRYGEDKFRFAKDRVDLEADKFIQYYTERGYLSANWQAKFNIWLGNAHDFKPAPPKPGQVLTQTERDALPFAHPAKRKAALI